MVSKLLRERFERRYGTSIENAAANLDLFRPRVEVYGNSKKSLEDKYDASKVFSARDVEKRSLAILAEM